MSDDKPDADASRPYAYEDDYGRRRMPSTESRRYADLITLVRDLVADAEESNARQGEIYREIWDLASKQERDALLEFASWFEIEPPDAVNQDHE
jgi:hypothetical protein